MTDTPAAPATEVRGWFSGDSDAVPMGAADETWWVFLVPAGLFAGWMALAAALIVGGWAAGDVVAPTPEITARVVWLAVSGGYRLDEAWLLASPATAVAPAAYLWVVFGLTLTTMAATASATVQWWRAGRPAPWGDAARERRPSRRFRSRRWPLQPPYTPQRPGPGVLLGRERGSHTVAGDGLPVLVVGPTGSGKTRHLIGPNVANWPGPVVATSVKTDLADYTAAHRARRGRCFGFDPGGTLWGWMRSAGITPVVWDPVRLLDQDPTHEHAKLLAQFLVSHSSAHDAGSQGIWSTLAGEVLASVLLIANDVGQPLKVALRWMIDVNGVFFSKNKNSEFAVAVRESPTGRLSVEARRALRDLRLLAQNDPRIWGSIEVTIREVTGALTNTAEHHPDADLVPVDLTVDPDRHNTLFLVADHMTQTTYSSVFAALVRHLFHVTESSHPDADRPAARPLFALDELANLARIEDLPEVLSTIRARAQVIVGIQEISQLVSGWGRDKATTVVGNLPTKVILPGSSDASALRAWAELSGNDDDYALDTWRTVKTGRARILAGNRDPFEIQLADPRRWMPTLDPPTAIPPSEPEKQAPCPTGSDGAPAETATQCPQRRPADQPELFDSESEPFDIHPDEPEPSDIHLDEAELEPFDIHLDEDEPEPSDIHLDKPEHEPVDVHQVGHEPQCVVRRPLHQRLWAAGVARLRRGWDAMFGPLPDDGGDDQAVGWDDFDARFGVADLLHRAGPAPSSHSLASADGLADISAPASTPPPEPAPSTVLAQSGSQGAPSGPVFEQLRVVNDEEGAYGLHHRGFVVDLTPHEDDGPEDTTPICKEVT